MSDLTPITRDEKLWSGEDLEPKTRREMYIKHLYDETQVIPEKPITREEMFILKAGEELHDVTIEQLTATENRTYSEEGVAYSPVIVNVPQTTLTTLDVTENGTYTAPSGTAYDEVEVDVPLPDNAYLLKDIPATPASIATFTDGSALPMPKLEIAVEPQQSGSGDPSPTNIRPISGWTGANVSVCGVNNFNKNDAFINAYCDYSNHIVSNNDMRSAIIPVKSGVSYRIITGGLSLGMNRYGYTKTYPQAGDDLYNRLGNIGIEEFVNNNVITVPNGFSYLFITFYRYNVATDSFDDVKNAFGINYPSTDTDYHAYNGHTTTIQFTDSQGNPIEVYGGECDVVNGGGSAYKEYDSYNGETLIGPWISDRDVYVPNTSPTTGAQVVDMGDTSTFTSQPTSIKSLEGTNNVWADCGKISEGSYFSKGEEE